MYIPLSDDKHQMVQDSSKNALASVDVIVTQLLRYHMPLLYFVCNHLIFFGLKLPLPTEGAPRATPFYLHNNVHKRRVLLP